MAMAWVVVLGPCRVIELTLREVVDLPAQGKENLDGIYGRPAEDGGQASLDG